MPPSFLVSAFARANSRWPLQIHAAAWTMLLTVTVSVASFSPQVAFLSAISPSSSFSLDCKTEDSLRVPLDLPGEILCLPDHLFRKSKIDLIVPPVFAAAVVAGSALLVSALGLWDDDAFRQSLHVRPR